VTLQLFVFLVPSLPIDSRSSSRVTAGENMDVNENLLWFSAYSANIDFVQPGINTAGVDNFGIGGNLPSIARLPEFH
jgi:hypothetical protein